MAGIVAGGRPLTTDSAAVPTAGLIAWYKLDSISGGVLTDETGAHPGTVTDATLVAGKIGSAIQCNGATTLGSIPHSPALDCAAFTLSVWVKFTGTQNLVIAEKNGNSGWSIQTMSDALVSSFGGPSGQVMINSGGITSSLLSGASVNNGQWRHIAAVVDYAGGINKFYVDGSLTSPSSGLGSSVSGVPTYISDPLSIGQRPTNVGPFAGAIDNIRYYNRALSAAEVLQLFNE